MKSDFVYSSDEESLLPFGASASLLRPPREAPAKRGSKKGNPVVSCFIVFVVVTTWAISGEIVQDDAYVAAHMSFSRICVVAFYSVTLIAYGALAVLVPEPKSEEDSERSPDHLRMYLDPIGEQRKGLFRRAWPLCIVASLLIWGEGYLWYISLQSTSEHLNSSLYQCQCIYVYILSVFVLGEPVVTRKILAICISLAGVILVSYGGEIEASTVKTTPTGVILTIASAIVLSVYQVLQQLAEERFFDAGDSGRQSMLFFGYCGVTMIPTGAVLVAVAHFTGWEKFDIPSLASMMIILKIAALDTILTCGIVLGISYAGAVFMSVGMLSVVPVSFLTDWLLGKLPSGPGSLQIAGVCVVVLGYLLMNFQFPTLTLSSAMGLRKTTPTPDAEALPLLGKNKKNRRTRRTQQRGVGLARFLDNQKAGVPGSRPSVCDSKQSYDSFGTLAA